MTRSLPRLLAPWALIAGLAAGWFAALAAVVNIVALLTH